MTRGKKVFIQNLMLPPQSTIREAIEILTSFTAGMILVVDDKQKLLGVVVDSDIRKAFLNGGDMNTRLNSFMNKDPFTLPSTISREAIKREFKKYPRSCIPLLDEEGRVVNFALLSDYFAINGERTNTVVLMAGGTGRRLMPITNNKPKPLVDVGGKPILELIINHLQKQGFRDFIAIVNHFGEQIQSYFGNGEKWDVNIEYIFESKRMGTAGGLSLINRDLDEPFIVMNADLLTNIDCCALIDFHQKEDSKATVCVREYNFQIPFGVVNVGEGRMVSLDEKPLQRFFVNAGIYVFEPSVLNFLDKSEASDMPELLDRINRVYPNSITCFPITEYWLDIGRFDDYEKAQEEYHKVFKK